MAQTVPELTNEHLEWVTKMESDHPNLPMGFARAAVEKYLMDPDYFTRENIEKIKRESKVPEFETKPGSCEVITGEAAEELSRKMVSQSAATIEPLADPQE